ncbi:hypothetical protein PG991_011372 [Apiospora marii]|uniref:Carrier domain-containing protein n=1 Tax=Apiospora marii TaxID=335849 RepID=A0ABR1RG10_9PEZI
MKGFVILTDPAKPLPHASKGTVQRHAVFKLYEAEFKALYERMSRFDPAKSWGTKGGEPQASDEMNRMIEAIVERKVSAALDRFAAALQAAADQLRSTTVSSALDTTTQQVQQLNGSINGANGNVNSAATRRLRRIIYDTLAENLDIANLEDDNNLFEFGLDSLQAVSLLTVINAFIIKSEQRADLIEREAIYSNPTVTQLIALFNLNRRLNRNPPLVMSLPGTPEAVVQGASVRRVVDPRYD